MGTHISLLGNIYSYGSYPGYTLIFLAAVTDLLDDILELFQELVLNKRLHFRFLCDHLMGMRLTGIHFMGMTSWACI
jgi:hypothetical protein